MEHSTLRRSGSLATARRDGIKRRAASRQTVQVRGVTVQSSRHTRPQDSIKTALTIGAICGFALAFTPIFAPIHELGHVSQAWERGCEAEIVDWNHTSTTCTGDGSVRLFGFWFEHLVFLALALAGRKKGWGIAALGYATGTYFFAFMSTDLNTPALQLAWAVSGAPGLSALWYAYSRRGSLRRPL